jgi:hypothetical protein
MSIQNQDAIHGVERIVRPGVDLQVAEALSRNPQPVSDPDGGQTGLRLALEPEPVTITTGLNVSGLARLDGGLDAATALITGPATVNGSLTVEGLSTGGDVMTARLIATTVDVTGSTTMASATVGGNLAANGGLSVRGRASLFAGPPQAIPLPGSGRRTLNFGAETDGLVIQAGGGTLTIGALLAEVQRNTPAMLPVQAGGTFTVAAQAATTAYFMPLGLATGSFRAIL